MTSRGVYATEADVVDARLSQALDLPERQLDWSEHDP